MTYNNNYVSEWPVTWERGGPAEKEILVRVSTLERPATTERVAIVYVTARGRTAQCIFKLVRSREGLGRRCKRNIAITGTERPSQARKSQSESKVKLRDGREVNIGWNFDVTFTFSTDAGRLSRLLEWIETRHHWSGAPARVGDLDRHVYSP